MQRWKSPTENLFHKWMLPSSEVGFPAIKSGSAIQSLNPCVVVDPTHVCECACVGKPVCVCVGVYVCMCLRSHVDMCARACVHACVFSEC